MTASRLAMIFPGQGSRAVGLLADLAAQYTLAQETLPAGAAAQQPGGCVETAQAFAERSVTMAIKAGPGKVLTGLGKRMAMLPVLDRAGLRKAAEMTAHA